MSTPTGNTASSGPGTLLSSMARTRLELALVDLETHVARSIGALALGAAALLTALIAAVFVGVTTIVHFWDTHRLVAAVSVTGAYAGLALAFAVTARRRWASRPPAFAGVLRELERDREALRGRL